jgi:hypothetical protein
MRKAWPGFFVLGLAVLLVAWPDQGLAQENPSQLYLMGDFLVDASRAGEYEAALKELLANLEKHGFPFRFDTYTTDDSHYFVVYGLKDFAEVNRWITAWGEQARQMGPENLQAVHRRIVSAEIERIYQFWYFRPDISFLPEKERLKPEDIGHYVWDFVWVIPGKEAEFEALNKDWIALSRAKKARDPFRTYAGDLGTNMPVYVWLEYGRSPADYALAEERFWKSVGADGAVLSKRTRALIRKLESKTGRYRPDLSFDPER